MQQQSRLRLENTKKHGNEDCPVDNRAIWVCAIVVGLRNKQKKVADAFRRLLPLFAAFFAIEAGTNNAERGLGRHSRHRKAHQGPRETATSWSEVTFEVHEDGPEHEREIAIPPVAESSGDLQMTDFSRRCTILWRAVHGRRFCSYTPREKEKKKKNKNRLEAAWVHDTRKKRTASCFERIRKWHSTRR